MKKAFKITGILITTGIIVCSCIFIYFYSTKGNYIYIDVIKNLIWDIKDAESLPEDFYICYEKMYPNSINPTFSLKKNPHKPTAQIEYFNHIYIFKHDVNPIKHILARYYLLRTLENNTTQQQCLNYWLADFNYLNGCIGVKEASLFYMKKNIDELDESEINTLIKMRENPSYYNPLKEGFSSNTLPVVP